MTDRDQLMHRRAVLRHIKARHGAVDGPVYSYGTDGDGWAVFADQGAGSLVPVLRGVQVGAAYERDAACDVALVKFAACAHADIAFLFDLLDASFAEIRRLKQAGGAKDYAANAAMMVADSRFCAFIAGRVDEPIGDAARATAQLKRHLEINSRAQLNTDPAKGRLWVDLVRDYQAHLRHGNVEGSP